MTDIANKSLRTFKDTWIKIWWYDLTNVILVNTLSEKLDKKMQKAYKLSLMSKETASLNNFIEFLKSASVVLY